MQERHGLYDKAVWHVGPAIIVVLIVGPVAAAELLLESSAHYLNSLSRFLGKVKYKLVASLPDPLEYKEVPWEDLSAREKKVYLNIERLHEEYKSRVFSQVKKTNDAHN